MQASIKLSLSTYDMYNCLDFLNDHFYCRNQAELCVKNLLPRDPQQRCIQLIICFKGIKKPPQLILMRLQQLGFFTTQFTTTYKNYNSLHPQTNKQTKLRKIYPKTIKYVSGKQN